MGSKNLIFISILIFNGNAHAISWTSLFSKIRTKFSLTYGLGRSIFPIRHALWGSAGAAAGFFSSKTIELEKPTDPAQTKLTNWILEQSLYPSYLRKDLWGYLRTEPFESGRTVPGIGLTGRFVISGKFSGEKPVAVTIQSKIEGSIFEKYLTTDAFTQCNKVGNAKWECNTSLAAQQLMLNSGQWQLTVPGSD